MEMARNVIRSRIQGMSDSEYNAHIRDLLRTAKNDAEAAQIKKMYDKMRAAVESAPSRQENIRRGMDSPLKKARGGKIKGYAHGGKACRGRKANYKA